MLFWNLKAKIHRNPSSLASQNAMNTTDKLVSKLLGRINLLRSKFQYRMQNHHEIRIPTVEHGLLPGESSISKKTNWHTNKDYPPRISTRRHHGYKSTLCQPKVVLVGRPNVGKSSLINRLTGNQHAVVYDYPGVTRDRLYQDLTWNGRAFSLVDTGGVQTGFGGNIERSKKPKTAGRFVICKEVSTSIERQVALAAEEAEVFVVVMDGQQGLTGSDREIVQWLRRCHDGKPVILAVNKCENPARVDLQLAPFWELGFEPVPVSAVTGAFSGDLLDRIVKALPISCEREPQVRCEGLTTKSCIRVAITGRPNVGKSSLLNALISGERSIVSQIPGTTRDIVHTEFIDENGTSFTLIDTAGIRKKASVASSRDGLEGLSVQRSLRAIKSADVVMLVLDANRLATAHDVTLALNIVREGRACVVVVNKWDSLPNKAPMMRHEKKKKVMAALKPIAWSPVLFTSAKNGQGIKGVFNAITMVCQEHQRRIPTATINIFLSGITQFRSQGHSETSGGVGSIHFSTQVGIRPPTFVMFVNDLRLFSQEHQKHVENQLRDQIGFCGTPLRILWRDKPNGIRKAS